MSGKRKEKYAKISEKEPLNKEKPVSENKTFIQKLRYLKANVSVEPILAGLAISSTLSKLAVQNLNLDKACRVKLQYGDQICDDLINKRDIPNITDYEKDVQKVISAIEAWKSIIQTAIPTILVIYMGAWSDRTGNRKFCILLPLFGELLVTICNLISTFFFYEIPVEYTMALEAIFPALTGNWVMVFLGVFSYISDVTDAKNRTYRVGIVNLCLTAGIPLGTSLSGILLKVLGYYGVFTLSASIYVITIIYGMMYLKSCTKPGITKEAKIQPLKVSDIGSLLKETADVALRKRENNLRPKIILTLIVVAAIYGPNHGERLITYMYVRYKLKWDAIKYSVYSTYSIITHSIGALFSISVFSKRWGFHDSVLCLISIASKLAGSIALAFVETNMDMFRVPLIEILNATTYTSLRSMASKMITPEEMGKMNSLFSFVETLSALMFDPLYSGLYFATIAVLPGAVYFFSASMTIPAIAILIWLYLRTRKDLNQLRDEARQEMDEVIEREGGHH